MKKAVKVLAGIGMGIAGLGVAAWQLFKKETTNEEVIVDDGDYTNDEVYATDMDGEIEE